MCRSPTPSACWCSTAGCRCTRALPGERELAEALGVSRTTAAAAYAALRDDGFLVSRRGAGSWTSLPADRRAAPAAAQAAARPTA